MRSERGSLVPAATPSANALLDGRVRLLQPERGYRVAIDPVLLAAAVPAGEGDRVLDVGTGTGAAALCLLARVPTCEVVGLELQPDLARLASQNAASNAAGDRFTVVEGDLRFPPAALRPGSFDHAMANPPYLERSAASPARERQKEVAHIEGEADLSAWVAFCARMLRRRGSVTMVHRADRLDMILAAYRQHGIGGMAVFPLWPKADGRDARRVLVAGRKGARSPLRFRAGIVLHREDGAYTPEAERVLREGAALPLC